MTDVTFGKASIRRVAAVLLPEVPVKWRPLAKDGAELPVALRTPVAAIRQTIATGETFDFEVEPAAGGVWWLDVKRAGGEWVQQVRVEVR